MKHAIVLALAACNQVYGLEDTRLADPVPPDAAPTCQDKLAFDRRFEQVILMRCAYYVPAADGDLGLASCGALDGRQFFADGPVDKPLVEVALEAHGDSVARAFPRLAPEGDRALITHLSDTLPPTFSVHYRDATKWAWAYDLPVVGDYDATVGTPSRRPHAHVMHASPNAARVDELVEDTPDNWRIVRSYTPQDLGTISLYTMFNLTPDGLHVVYQRVINDGTYEMTQASRTNIDAPFGPGTPLEGIPRTVFDAFMTNDCGRIYFSGLSSIFYARQL